MVNFDNVDDWILRNVRKSVFRTQVDAMMRDLNWGENLDYPKYLYAVAPLVSANKRIRLSTNWPDRQAPIPPDCDDLEHALETVVNGQLQRLVHERIAQEDVLEPILDVEPALGAEAMRSIKQDLDNFVKGHQDRLLLNKDAPVNWRAMDIKDPDVVARMSKLFPPEPEVVDLIEDEHTGEPQPEPTPVVKKRKYQRRAKKS